MSFFHYLCAGHFDLGGDRRLPLRVREPLEPALVAGLLLEFSDNHSSEAPVFCGRPGGLVDGYVYGLLYASLPCISFVRFALALHDRTHCDLIESRSRERISPDSLRRRLDSARGRRPPA